MARDIIPLVTGLNSRVIDDYKVFTGVSPFNNSPPTTVAVRILSGIRPDRPVHPRLTSELWDLNQRCWNKEPSQRPGILKVVSHLRNALNTQDDHVDGTDVSRTCKTIPSSRQGKQSHRMSPLHYPQECISRLQGLRPEPTHSTTLRRFLTLCPPFKSSQREGGFDESLDAESEVSGETLHHESERNPYKRIAASGPGSFLQETAFWFSDRGARFRRHHHGSSDTLEDKHGTTKLTATLLHPTAMATPGNAPESNDVPPTSDHEKSCSCTYLRPFIFQWMGVFG